MPSCLGGLECNMSSQAHTIVNGADVEASVIHQVWSQKVITAVVGQDGLHLQWTQQTTGGQVV